jgi:hypothetical protein
MDKTPLVSMGRDALLDRVAKLGTLMPREQIHAVAAGHAPEDLSDDGLRLLIAAIELRLRR